MSMVNWHTNSIQSLVNFKIKECLWGTKMTGFTSAFKASQSSAVSLKSSGNCADSMHPNWARIFLWDDHWFYFCRQVSKHRRGVIYNLFNYCWAVCSRMTWSHFVLLLCSLSLSDFGCCCCCSHSHLLMIMKVSCPSIWQVLKKMSLSQKNWVLCYCHLPNTQLGNPECIPTPLNSAV